MVLDRCLTTLRNDFNLPDVRVINIILGLLGAYTVLEVYLLIGLSGCVTYHYKIEIFSLFNATYL